MTVSEEHHCKVFWALVTEIYATIRFMHFIQVSLHLYRTIKSFLAIFALNVAGIFATQMWHGFRLNVTYFTFGIVACWMFLNVLAHGSLSPCFVSFAYKTFEIFRFQKRILIVDTQLDRRCLCWYCISLCWYCICLCWYCIPITVDNCKWFDEWNKNRQIFSISLTFHWWAVVVCLVLISKLVDCHALLCESLLVWNAIDIQWEYSGLLHCNPIVQRDSSTMHPFHSVVFYIKLTNKILLFI